MKKLLLLLLTISLYAENLHCLLNKFEKDNDFSQITKQESAGISYVITRYQLDMMQAKYLKDVLKNTVISDYLNRYNLLDPFALTMSPFGNNNIKVYIDNYEITSMSSENSVFLFSNLNLNFVDHIEIYYFSSADKYFGEPTYAVIKLYSKNPSRDKGLSLNLGVSSKYNYQSIGYGNSNYYIYSSRNEVTNDNIQVNDKKVSKNSRTYHIFAKLNKGDNNFIFNSLIDKRDAFLGMSADGRIDTSKIENKQFLIGYNRNFEKFSINYILNYQSNYDEFAQNDRPLFTTTDQNISKMYTSGDNFTNSLKLDTQIINNEKVKLSSGILYKNEKNLNIDYRINDQENFNGIKNQSKYTFFIDNTYQYLPNSILSVSASYSIYDNDVVDNYYIHNYKIGNTYLYDKNNIFKVFYFHIENIPPNYLVNSIFQNSTLKPTITNSYIFKYKKNLNLENKLEFIFVTGDSTDQIIYNNGGLENDSNKIKLNFLDVRWNKTYKYINNLTIEAFKMIIENNALKSQSQVSILNTHRCMKFDFFENLIYKNLKTDHINDGLDLDLGVKYNYNENLTFSLKGESLLSTRYDNEYVRYDVLTNEQLPNFRYASTPRNIVFNLEYSF